MYDKIKKTSDFTVSKFRKFIRKRAIKRVNKNIAYQWKKHLIIQKIN